MAESKNETKEQFADRLLKKVEGESWQLVKIRRVLKLEKRAFGQVSEGMRIKEIRYALRVNFGHAVLAGYVFIE